MECGNPEIRPFGLPYSLFFTTQGPESRSSTTRQGQPKKYICAQRDMMDLKGGFFCF